MADASMPRTLFLSLVRGAAEAAGFDDGMMARLERAATRMRRFAVASTGWIDDDDTTAYCPAAASGLWAHRGMYEDLRVRSFAELFDRAVRGIDRDAFIFRIEEAT